MARKVFIIVSLMMVGLLTIPAVMAAAPKSSTCVTYVDGVPQLNSNCKNGRPVKKAKAARTQAQKTKASRKVEKVTFVAPKVDRKNVVASTARHNGYQNLMSAKPAQPRVSVSMPSAKTQSSDVNQRNSQLVAQSQLAQSSSTKLNSRSLQDSSLSNSTESLTLKLPEQQPAKPKRWGFVFDSENDVPMDAANRAKGDFLADNTATLSYKATDKIKISIAQEFINSWGSTPDAENGKFTLLDPYFEVGTSEIGRLPLDMPLKAYLRVALPMSEYSQSIGQVAYFRSGFGFGHALGAGFNLGYSGSPRYYWQNYRTATAKGSDKQTANKDYRYLHFVQLDWAPSKYFSMTQKTGLDHVWYHGDSNYGINPKYQEFFFSDTSMSLMPINWFALTLGIATDDRDLLSQGNEFSAYREEEAHYYVEFTFTF